MKFGYATFNYLLDRGNCLADRIDIYPDVSQIFVSGYQLFAHRLDVLANNPHATMYPLYLTTSLDNVVADQLYALLNDSCVLDNCLDPSADVISISFNILENSKLSLSSGFGEFVLKSLLAARSVSRISRQGTQRHLPGRLE